MDFKQKYIVKCVSSLLALPEEPAELINSEKLAEFTGSKAINVLLVLFVPGKKTVKVFFPQDDFPRKPNILMVTVCKLNSQITHATLADCFSISLTTADCLNNLALELARVYLPNLQDKSGHLESLMVSVKNTLGTHHEQQEPKDESMVQSVNDQFNYWRQIQRQATNPQAKQRAIFFQECYKSIQGSWGDLNKLNHKELKELTEMTFSSLDSIWTDKYAYNSKRFATLLKLMTHTLWQALSSLIPKVDIDDKGKIPMIEDVMKNWIKFLEDYRNINWLGKKVNYLQPMTMFTERIQDVKRVLTLLDEVRVIKEKTHIDIDLGEIEEEFSQTVPLSLNPILVAAWNRTKKVFEAAIEAESVTIVGYIRENVISAFKTKSKPLKILQNLKLWNVLLSLTSIRKATLQQKSMIFKTIVQYVKEIKHEFESRTGQSFDPIPGKESIVKIKNFTPFLCGILWVRQSQDKVRRVLMYCLEIFDYLSEIEAFKADVDSLLKDMNSYQEDQLNQWKSEMEEAEYSDSGLKLQMNGKMMELDLKTSTLTVNYSDKLVILIRQIRQLVEIGLKSKIPPEVIETAEQGKRYYKEALNLKKIASFYNNMGSEIIECQRGMVLKELQYFQECVRNVNKEMKGGQLTWVQEDTVEAYVESLNAATNQLMRENGKLRKIHEQIMDVIIQLAGHDLRKSRSMWLIKLEQIKALIETACMGKQAKYCRKWKVHCDVQLYKALEMQYLLGLEDSQSVFSDINVEVQLKNRVIAFKPSLEELKDKYYKEITNYLMWPARVFKGILGNLDLYQKLGDRNSIAIKSLIAKAQATFALLGLHLRSLEQWGAISNLNVKNINKKLKTMQEWQFNIRVIRLKRKQLQKVPDQHRMQCFNISNVKFKNAVDEFFVDFLEQMMHAMKVSVIAENKEIEEFLKDSLVKLAQKPKSMEEMQQTKAVYMEIKIRQKETKRRIDEILIKKKWIMLATGYNHDTTNMEQSWEEFAEKLLDYDNLLKEQVEHLKGIILSRTKQLETEMESYIARTSSITLPSNRVQMSELMIFLAAERERQKQIVDKMARLKADCEQFELTMPSMTIKQVDWSVWSVLEQYLSGLQKHQNESYVKIKSDRFYEFQDFCLAWSEKSKQMEKSKQVMYIIKETDLFKNIFALLRMLSSGVLEKDHWKSFWTIIKADKQIPTDSIKLGDMLNIGRSLLDKMNILQQLIARAQGEATLREALQQLAIWWQTAEFELTVYEGKKCRCSLIKEWKEMTSKVSDNMCLISSLKESRWVGKLLEQIQAYQMKIGKVERALYGLNAIQRRWIYLEPILTGGALPQQLERFNRLDVSFRRIMGIIAEKLKLQALVDIDALESILDTIQQEQEKCQKALNEFLEVKRSKFPRFYFLGDEDLLEILAQTQNPTVIQLHMKKLFAAINTVGFTADNKQIVEMFSIQKERVSLTRKVMLTENVQDWLNSLEKSMFITLQSCLKDYLTSGTKEIKLADYSSQILCLVEEIRFSAQLEASLKAKTMGNLQSKLRQNLLNLTKILPTVSKLEQVKLKAIILDLIHHLNITTQLVKEEAVNLNCYNYRKNYRFTSVPEMHLFEYKYKYTFEYQGNLPKLVHTPLTDKCYITLSLALSMGLGGNPYGPAGTGKTETVKAMAMLFGRMCLVFNCDEGLDYKSMARIFLGLVRCGAWGCFDEFNRLLEEQLSAISQQIQVIQFAIKANQTHLQLIGTRVQVNANSGIFVTLNPAGKGYGGRSKLPDNLKQLFRPVAMSVPNNELIAEVLLYSEGFKQAKQLAQKIICLFTLSRQLLSQQQHYDWGLRALKTILSVAGRLIFEERTKSKNQVIFEVQCELLIKAIRVNTLSKLTFTDIRKFKLLLQDIFPKIDCKDIVYEQIESAIKLTIEEMKLSYNDAQVAKILQFYEATQQRMGVVIVGPSGCGKTTIWKVLKRCYEKLGLPLKTYLINPKSMPRQQLLGQMNNDTREFSQGVLTVSARQVIKNTGNNWIILDGDIDPQWVQSLNSVLDDNHLLTLPTGQRINFPQGTCFIFQTDSLLYASPATVSRMGMIYLNNEDINIAGVVQKGIEKFPQLAEYIKTLQVETLVGYEEIVPSTLIGQINQILSQLEGVNTLQEFICACARGMTANYLESKAEIVNVVFGKFKQKNPFSQKESLTFYAQGRVLRSFSTLPSQFLLQQIISGCAVLKTAGMQSLLATLKPWVQTNQNFIVVGPQGCGKSILIQQAYSQIRKSYKINFSMMYCNSQTSARHVIDKLYQICAKANSGSGKILRPKDCTRQVVYLKDINLPKPDKYQAIQLASFLQQVISHKGFYDPTTLEFVLLDEKIQIVASMFPPSSIGRNQLTQRFTTIVRILTMEYPSNEDLVVIYTEYFRALLSTKKLEEGLCKPLAAFFIDSYSSINKAFSVDQHRHYSLTPKSLKAMFINLNKYDFNNQQGLLEALANQLKNGYRNKIVSLQRKSKFDQLLNGIFRNHFKTGFNSDNIFCFVSGNYVKIKKDDYLVLLKAALLQCMRDYRELYFVAVDDSINWISSIEKVLAGRGNILLVGTSGVGRQTHLLLASLMAKLDIVKLTTVREYSVRDLKKEMKSIIETTVNENKKQILFLEDHNFSKPEFMEMINSLLISGEIPGLFSLDEIDRLPCSQNLKNQYVGLSLQQALAEKVKANLKIVVSLDYSKDSFHETCASNPALFTCNIIWFDSLPALALRAIAAEQITRYLPQLSKATVDEISSAISDVQKEMEAKLKVPQRHFYALGQTFVNIFVKKSKAKKNQGLHLQKGLEKLDEAKKLVDVLSKQAYQKQKLLQVKKIQAAKAMSEIERAVGQATKRKTEKEELSRNLQVEENKMMAKKQSVESDLAEVKPLIEQAKQSVSGINSSNLNELASLPKPPQAIKIVMKAVVLIFGETNPEWNVIKNFIKNKSFIDNILNFDPRSMSAETRREVEKEITKNAGYFEKEVIYRASLAAGPLADWAKAIIRYSKVVESIRPLQMELNKLLDALQASKKRVAECQEERTIIDKKVQQLKGVFAVKTGQGQVLKNELAKSQSTLKTAKNLLGKLQDQRVRWDSQYKSIQKQMRDYPTSSFIAAAFMTYLSDRDENERQIILNEWKVKFKIASFSFLKFMTTESIQLKWRSLGLASDSLSIENSVMIFCTSKVPLLLDPNSQAIEWLKKNQEKMQVINQRNPKFANALELAVRFGKELLIQQLQDIEGILVPIIRKDVQQQGTKVVLRVGDKMVDCSPTFKLYLSTRNSNMDLSANTAALVCLINYSVTKSGLESKLLSMVINHEQPELEQKKSQLLLNQDKLKSSLQHLEEQLLNELGNSSGNILENKSLLENLTKTKAESINIAQSLKQSQSLNARLDVSRDIYRPLSKKGAVLYLLISQLNKINNMYRFSLAYFIGLFLACLNDQEQGKLSIAKKDNVEKLAQAEFALNRIIFNHIATSLFKVDRLLFALYLIKGITTEITQDQWQFFTGIFPMPLQIKVVLPKWANFDRQEAFNHFCAAMPKLTKSINFTDIAFESWFKSEEAIKDLPQSCLKLSKFQKILIVLVFKPEKLQSALINFACEVLRIPNLSGNGQSIKAITQKQASDQIPALFIVSTGYDPSKELQQFCQAQVGRENYLQLSMGGGQNEAALSLLRQASEKGQWLCLKNIHLVTTWLPILQKEFKGLQKRHNNFRLFLTSEQHHSFPNVLLETCYKVTYESPPGLKKNFIRTHQQLEAGGSQMRISFLFVLAYFHALIQERRSYIPQGWSKMYQFSYSDLKMSLEIVANILKEYETTKHLNFETLYGIFQEGIYGGRIDNPSDLKVLRAYLRKYFNLLVVNGQFPLGFDLTVPKTHKELNEFISRIPQIDDPSIYGLPRNIDKAIQRSNALLVTQCLNNLSLGNTEGVQLKKQNWIKAVTPLIKTWGQTYKQIKDAKFPTIKQSQIVSENPIESFIYLEATQALELVQKIQKKMEILDSIIQGKGLMSTESKILINHITNRTLPKEWQQFWSECQDPAQWIRKFGRRLEHLKQWVLHAQNSRLEGQQFDLSEVFHPGVFVNACKQNASRNKIALDKLTLVATFQEAKATTHAIKLKGLLLQGCSLVRNLLDTLSQKEDEYEFLPVLYMDFLSNPPPMYSNEEQFCLFSSPRRDNLLMKLQLGIAGDASEKIIAGTALMLKDL